MSFENRSFWRNPASAFFTFAFPLMFLVIFNLLFGDEPVPVGNGEDVEASNFYVPAIAAFSIITACYTNIAMGVSFARDQGVLKRKRGTPLPSWAYLGGRVIHAVLVAVLLVTIVVAFGVLFYNVDAPVDAVPNFLTALVVGAAAFCALGLATSAIVPNADAAPAVVNATILPLLFISNVFIPDANAPEWLKTFAGFFPVKHFADAMLASFNPALYDFEFFDLLVVALWGVAGAAFAIRNFSWEPRR
ncbi:MAG TPA: ABC transporter permease [Actinomycetota bacterium]|nr:ABC transporter permease [Actinomycetota bacterium]